MINNVEYHIVVLQSENSYVVRGILNNEIITPSYSVTRVMREGIVYGDLLYDELISLVRNDLLQR